MLILTPFSYGQLSGVYTVGEPSDDFPYMEDVLDAIETSGISGNVEIRISNGVYGNIDLTDFSPPLGAKLVFSSASENSADVIFESANLVTSNNIELRHMTFNMPSPTLEKSVVYIERSDSIRISNCRILDTASTWTVWYYAPLEVDHGWDGGLTTILVDSSYIYSGDGILIPKSSTRQTILEKGSGGRMYFKNDSIFGSVKVQGTSVNVKHGFENCYLKVLQDIEDTESIDSCEIIFYPWNIEDTIGSGTIRASSISNTSVTASHITIGANQVINCNFSENFRTSLYAGKNVLNNFIGGKTTITSGGTTLSPKPLLMSNVFSKRTYISGGGGNEVDVIVANNSFLDTVRRASVGSGAGGGKLHFYHNNFANGALLQSNSPGDIVNNNFADVSISYRANFLSNNNYNWQDSSTLHYSYYDNSPTYYDPEYNSPTDLHVNNPSIVSAGTHLIDTFLEEDFEEDLRDTIPTIGADETCLNMPLADTIKLMCATNYALKMCDFDTLNHWSSDVVYIDSTLSNPVVYVDTIIKVYLRDASNNKIDSTVLFPELMFSRKRNLYGYCAFTYSIATFNQPGVAVDWSPGYLCSDSTSYITNVSVDTTTIFVATQDFGQCGTRYDSIVFNINSNPQAHIFLDSFACLDYKFRTAITCYDSIQWTISDGTVYNDVVSIWHTFPSEDYYEVIVKVWMNGLMATDEVSAVFACLGNEELLKEDFEIYPNPAHDGYFNVLLPPSMLGETYALYNNIGQEVKSGLINQENIRIPVDELKPGIYLFKIGTLTKKVVVQN